jgi:hypothetical protein
MVIKISRPLVHFGMKASTNCSFRGDKLTAHGNSQENSREYITVRTKHERGVWSKKGSLRYSEW